MTSPEQSEKDIESVLKSFASALPPVGLEQRVLRHTRLKSASSSDTSRFRLCMRTFAGAALAAALFAIWSFEHRETTVFIRPANVLIAAPNPPIASVGLGAKKAVPHAIPTASSQPHVSWARSTQDNAIRTSLEQTSTNHYPDIDAADAPSQQAPPLPLTNQEKLLLAAAHRHTSLPQIAKLRRPVWPLRDPAEDEDFRKFFDPKTQSATDGDNE